MRIDPSARINALEAGASAKSGSKASGAAGGGLASDQAALSPDQARVGALVAQTISLPEIRSEKVAQIASAIREGRYQVSAEQTADALLAELQGRSGVAA